VHFNGGVRLMFDGLAKIFAFYLAVFGLICLLIGVGITLLVSWLI
jgi:hypothetical protein